MLTATNKATDSWKLSNYVTTYMLVYCAILSAVKTAT